MVPVLVCYALLQSGGAAAAVDGERGSALVIGQEAYTAAGQDASSRADAANVGAALKRAGWRVDAQSNLTAAQLRGAIVRFAGSLKSGEAAMMYFSGLSAKGGGSQGGDGIDNVLLGIDARADKQTALGAAGLPLSSVVSTLNGARVQVMILIIDAARSNTLEAGWAVAPGLAEPTSALLTNAFIVFPASPGRLAREGLFAPELIRRIDRPGLSVERAVSAVSLTLDQTTGGEQVPWYSGSSASARWLLRAAQPGARGDGPSDESVFDRAVACGTEGCLLEAAAGVNDPFKSMDLRLRAAVAGAELAPLLPAPAAKPNAAAPSYVQAFVENNKSSAEGMGRVGQNYLHGANGFPRDADQAYPWLMRAAFAGDLKSNYEVGLIFETGAPPVGHVDKYAAAPLFKRAAEGGDRDAEYYLGLYYLQGEGGLSKNTDLGAQWIARAASQGQPSAITFLSRRRPGSPQRPQ
jgi:TPR repeat protein